jgi:hypothetical protein
MKSSLTSILLATVILAAVDLRGFKLLLAILPAWLVLLGPILEIMVYFLPPRIELAEREFTLDGRDKPFS